MWLPTDERRLLAGYYAMLGEVGESKVFRLGDLGPLLGCFRRSQRIREYGDPDEKAEGQNDDYRKWIKSHFDKINRINRANKHLVERGFLIVDNHRHEPNVIVVSLTIGGYDLGRKYAHFLTRSGLWFAEYQNHWAWLVAAFIGGGFASKLLEKLLQLVFSADGTSSQ